jgi:hypothetical protein
MRVVLNPLQRLPSGGREFPPMARSLQFTYGGRSVPCSIEKVDRGRLYGSRSLETLDSHGHPCGLATLAADGHTLIPMGGTAIGHIGSDGRWVEGDALTAVDAEGHPLPRIPSSFDGLIPLEQTVAVDRLLEHSIRLTYALTPLEGPLDAELASALESGAIFSFPFSWRGGVASDPAFLLRGEDGTVWLLIGDANRIRLVSLEQVARCGVEVEEEPLPGEAEADLDFRML